MKNRDDDRRAILARRARFVAAAVTAAGLATTHGCAREVKPEPCLEPNRGYYDLSVPAVDASAVEQNEDAGVTVEEPVLDAEPPPEPCLSF